jgi:hypothetical protein
MAGKGELSSTAPDNRSKPFLGAGAAVGDREKFKLPGLDTSRGARLKKAAVKVLSPGRPGIRTFL